MTSNVPNRWLHQQIASAQAQETSRNMWDPDASCDVAVSWAKALRWEIVSEHGNDLNDQYESCCQLYDKNRVKKRKPLRSWAPIFAPLFHAFTFSMSVCSLHSHNDFCRPWTFPISIVSWYYSIYFSSQSIIASFNNTQPDTHKRTIVGFGALRQLMPHPLDMIAVRSQGEKYEVKLPQYPQAKGGSLRRALRNRGDAQEFLLGYLSGTAKWEANITKQKIASYHSLVNFRTRQAQTFRDKALDDEINFLHCAFRFRGKANYRDSIFLTYGNRGWAPTQDFIDDLRITSQFVRIASLAYASHRFGEKITRVFLKDARENCRGLGQADDSEAFWTQIQI